MLRSSRLLPLTLLLLLVGTGCAPSSQVVRLDPEPPAATTRYQTNAAVALEVIDARDDKALGTLERPSGDPATITTDRDLPYTLKLAAAETLRGYGLEPGLWSDDAEPRLLIEIERLHLRVDSTLPYDITTEVVLSARAWQGGRTFEGRATANLNDVSAAPPGPKRNADYLNRAMTQALERLFEEKLPRFLAGRN